MSDIASQTESLTKRFGGRMEVDDAEDVARTRQTDVRHGEISGASFELGIPEGTLTRRRNYRDARILRELLRAPEFATACFVVRRGSKEARRGGARNRRLTRPRTGPGESVFIWHATASWNCAGASANPGAYNPRRTNQRSRSARHTRDTQADSTSAR